jgi:predicted ATPase with chaperone activity
MHLLTGPWWKNYQKRISGPMMDSIDIHVTVPRVEYDKLAGGRRGRTLRGDSRAGGGRPGRQRARFTAPTRWPANGTPGGILCNADMGPAEVRQFVDGRRWPRLLKTAMHQLRLSARAYHRGSSWPAPSPTWPPARPSMWPTWPRRYNTEGAGGIASPPCRLSWF